MKREELKKMREKYKPGKIIIPKRGEDRVDFMDFSPVATVWMKDGVLIEVLNTPTPRRVEFIIGANEGGVDPVLKIVRGPKKGPYDFWIVWAKATNLEEVCEAGREIMYGGKKEEREKSDEEISL